MFRLWRCLSCAGALLLLAGCTSYEVTRENARANDGVAFVLSRPEFSLKKVEGSDPAKYQPQVTYVPDPKQRYRVRMKTSPFADPTFDLGFNDQNGLSSSTADSQQQLAPTITSIAGLVTKTMAANSVLAALSPTAPAGGVSYGACLGVKGEGRSAACALTAAANEKADPNDKTGRCPAVGADFGPIQRLGMFYKDDDDSGDPLATLVSLTPSEDDCFKAAGNGLDASAKALAQALSEKLDTGWPVGEAAAAARAKVKAALADGDVTTGRRLVFALALAVEDGDTGPASKLLGKDITVAEAAAVLAALRAVEIDPEKGPASIQSVAHGLKVAKALKDAGGLAPGAWRSRAIVNLQSKILYEERDVLRTNREADAERGRVEAYRRQLAALVNMAPEFDRMLGLQKAARNPPSFKADTRQSQMTEYAAYLKVAADIQAELDKRLQAAQAKGPGAKAVDDLPVSSPWASGACVDEISKKKTWLYTYGVDAPKFVVVLRRADRTAIDPPNLKTGSCP